MADKIICPVCGEANPTDMEFCQNCQSRLLPLTGPLKGEDAPIHPGQIPTKKVTSELEPILPEWLREARKQARQSEQEEPTISGSDKQTKPLSQTPDLLAGLADQNKHEDEEDATPDWLRGITGEPARKKKNEPESSQVKWVELGHNEEPVKDDSENESPVLPWMAGAESAPEKDELTEWFKQAASPAHPSDDRPASHEVELPAPVQPDQSITTPPDTVTADVSEGMKDMDAFEADSFNDLAEPALSQDDEVPDWIKRLDAETPTAGQQPESSKETSSSSTGVTNVPDWLKSLDEESSASAQLVSGSGEVLPDWLTTASPSAQEPTASPPAYEPPTSPIPKEPSFVQPEPTPESKSDSVELPDWIASLTPVEPQASEPGEPAVPAFSTKQPPAEPTPPAYELPPSPIPKEPSFVQLEPTPEGKPDSVELPDWIASLTPVEPQASEPGEPAVPAFSTEQPSAEPTVPASAFTEIPDSSNDVDAIFASMKIPDWLSDIKLSQPSTEENLPPAAQEEELIEPAELPSWVQAMRPVEAAMRDTTAGTLDTKTEELGALAGLHGVLPAVPGAASPTSKPKSHSIKLDATDQQQAHAALLEQILSAETAPIPMKADSVPRSQRNLRWALSALLFIILGGVVFGRTEFFPLPAQVPNETIFAIQAVEAIPADAPVLVVFDYEPATIGEMEASGSSLMDHLLLLKHPRLALISTSPTGAALAERFMASTLADRTYLRGAQYVDLGYLPGGLAGVFDFSQNPVAVMPLSADSTEVWSSPVMQGVTHLSDFASVIVLTDSVEVGRVWIEQTALARGNTSLIIVSSAQAGPMFLPYVDSGQVKGLIAGLNGAAGAEQANGGLPGFVRRYWDPYSLGLLLAVGVMFIGGLWNFWLGIQDRRIREAG